MTVLVVGDYRTDYIVKKVLAGEVDVFYYWDEHLLPQSDNKPIDAIVVDGHTRLNGNLTAVAEFLQRKPTITVVLTDDGKGDHDGLFPDCMMVQWAESKNVLSILRIEVLGIYLQPDQPEHSTAMQTALF